MSVISIKLTLWTSVVVVLLVLEEAVCTPGHFSSTWAVHIPEGKEVADQVAAKHGFINLGEIVGNHYHFHHADVQKRSADPAHHHHSLLLEDARVSSAKQQKIISRKKRDFLPERKKVRAAFSISKTEGRFYLNDPKWPHMWYMNRGGGLDLNVIPAWREGITGKGVVVTILDDGLESDHPDLIDNYDPNASYDVNSHDSDPQPRYDLIDSNRHGTRCAGQVAAVANNSLCAVGIAYEAKVGGVRMLDGDVTDAVEARSLSINPQYVDIYSASWGPDDDGKTVDGPGELATRAFIEGVTKGRGGKGSIFVWASGNGGREKDNCNCDGYTNSIWTLSISAATENGDVPWYSEACSSTLATTYSSGALNEKQVVTTDIHHTCTLGHTGTSASAPLAAGICALTLQANPQLSWRDMQHIVVRTARPERLSQGTWRMNGVGRNVSSSFGYGLLDASAMVRTARSWKTVAPQKRCDVTGGRAERGIPPHGKMSASVRVGDCNVKFLEHVVARVSLAATRRGDLRIELVSPAGTRATLLAPRPHDNSRAGFNSWPFMSVHTWGESPFGKWTLEIFNEGKYMGGSLNKWELVFYGTETAPQDGDLLDQQGALLDVDNRLPEQPAPIARDRDSHQTRDDGSSKETQKLTVEEIVSEPPNSGCLTSSKPGFCLECIHSLHLHEGNCYSDCPPKTFPSELIQPVEHDKPKTLQKQIVMRRQAFEQMDMLSAEEDSKLKNRAIMPALSPKTCRPCHYSCQTCNGSLSHECLSCHDDAQIIILTNQSFCYPKGVVSMYTDKLKNILIYALLVFVIILTLYLFFRCLRSDDKDSGTKYDRLLTDESKVCSLEIEKEIANAIDSSSSDSEQEDLDLRF